MIRNHRRTSCPDGPYADTSGQHDLDADRIPATDILAREGWTVLPGVQSPSYRAQHRLGWMWSW